MTNEQLNQLEHLYMQASKHSAYQEVHPAITGKSKLLNEIGHSKHERYRQNYLDNKLDYKNSTILEIGSNTGYFSISAILNEAQHIVCYEGNKYHHDFLKTALNILQIESKATLLNEYYELNNIQNSSLKFDICIFLNVLHHLGDDFAGQQNSIQNAKMEMAKYVNSIANICKKMVFQMGFNWKGNSNLPLFEHGLKTEVIQFIEETTKGYWDIEEISALSHDAKEYMPISEQNQNLNRIDSIGEFMNRPIFILKSRIIK